MRCVYLPTLRLARTRAPLQGEGRECCIEYEMHNGAGWFRLAKAAILRNENSRRTTFELVLLPPPLSPVLGASAPMSTMLVCLCPLLPACRRWPGPT